ncbi:uncharacterized protein LOC113304172 [Papaver somniferum]|uniref:uncharacterized protein LOC113304172 n=1 Tax=Papaver somniferum TaxID=3469 RepID=UPI000E6F7B38|nr:uncharacterized protein LOC113304172 [Papaver somniferum]
MHVVASLVKISPIIETLTLELCRVAETSDSSDENSDDSSDDESESDEGSDLGSEPEQEMDSVLHTDETSVDSQELLANTMKQLKYVEISGLEGSDIELKFIEILIKSAMVLKKMVLNSHCRSKIKKFYEEVENFQSACASLRIYFYL